jgi:orotate phosphoribosyltransferase
MSEVCDYLQLHVMLANPNAKFRLASGGTSLYYVDVKRAMLHARMHAPLARLLFDTLFDEFGPVQAVAGVAVGGCHLASLVALHAALRGGPGLDVVFVRKEPKDHGARAGELVERPSSPPGRVVLLEDVITTGRSAGEAVGHLRGAGYDVRGVLAVVDRQPAREKIPGLPVRALFTLNGFEVSPTVP